MITGRKRLTQSDIDSHKARVPGVRDAIRASLYDFQAYALAGQTQLTFFALPVGQGTTSHPGGAGPKTLADTNMTGAGALPLGNRFYVRGICVEVYPGSVPADFAAVSTDAIISQHWNDVYVISRSGFLTFRVQNRDYVQDAPVGKFPTDTRLVGVAALATTAAASAEQIGYASFGGAPYSIVPVYLEATQGFSVTLNWPNVIALPSGVDARIGVRLVGDLVRDAQ